MQSATVTLDSDFVLSGVDPRLFGGFIEHLGRHIYTGIYEPGHPTADAEGFRQDVLELVRELRMPVMRYPGGNFVSGYRWEDGIGPKDARPVRLDLAWGAIEPNTFGTDEFINWCKKADTAPMLAVNLGTRGAEAAQALIEYCNHPGGTYWSDLRKKNGSDAPHNVKLWCLGNEMDGPWQMGAKTAYEYGRIANESAKLMKWTDPTIETVLCGSSGRGMATFGKWEWESLHEAYDNTDYLSLHTYLGNGDNDTPRFLAEPDSMSDFIRESAAVCDAVGASRKSKKKINLSFDEWNVWYLSPDAGEKWTVGRPQLEQVYTMGDALAVGGMLIALLNNADRVKIGCMAQVVNVIGPIMTEAADRGGRAWKQTIFHPFAAASQWGRGTALRSVVQSPKYQTRTRENADIVTLASTVQGDTLTLFAVNRDPSGQPVELKGTLRGFSPASSAEHTVLTHPDQNAVNTADAPNAVAPQPAPTAPTASGETFAATLPPYSWNVIRLRV